MLKINPKAQNNELEMLKDGKSVTPNIILSLVLFLGLIYELLEGGKSCDFQSEKNAGRIKKYI